MEEKSPQHTEEDVVPQTNNEDVDVERSVPQNEASDDARPNVLMGRKRFWTVLFGLNLGMLLTALDFNIIATAVPTISSEFGEYQKSAWLGTAFLVSLALVLPMYARLGVLFGNDIMFHIATAMFMLGSALCGWSTSMDMLIASRIIQGIGGGGVYGLVNVIITDIAPLKDVGNYLSITALVWILADVAGPLLGGVFSQYATWRWCFWINLIIAPISLVVSFFALKLPKPARGDSLKYRFLRFDYLGSIILSGGIVCVLLGVSWGGSTFPWSNGRVIGTLTGGVALLAVFLILEHRIKEPLIDPSVLRNRTVLAVLASELFYGANVIGMLYYVPQFFQLVFGDSATISGVGLLPMFLGLGVGNPIAAWITSRYQVSLINAQIGAAVLTLTSGLITRWNADTSRAEAYVLLVLLGLGQGATMSGLLLTAQAAVTTSLVGITTGLAIFVQMVGSNFGVAFFSAVYINELRASLERIVPRLSQSDIEIILDDPQSIEKRFNAETAAQAVRVYANSMRNGWWLMFAFAAAALLSSMVAKQHKFIKTTTQG